MCVCVFVRPIDRNPFKLQGENMCVLETDCVFSAPH